jgi:hypothetical protein
MVSAMVLSRLLGDDYKLLSILSDNEVAQVEKFLHTLSFR